MNLGPFRVSVISHSFKERWIRHEGNVDKARLNLSKIRGGV